MGALLEHGHTRYGGVRRLSPTYNSWSSMKRRCFNEDNHNFEDYGARGITIQGDWHDFENFLKDMGTRPDGMTLDRIDSDGDYTKENCRWATAQQQLLNRRNTPMLTVCGVTKSLFEWAQESVVDYGTIWNRVFKYGWDHARAITEPPKNRYRVKVAQLDN